MAETTHPLFLQTVFDTTDARASAEFWRQLLGYAYRPGHEAPAAGEPDDADWLILVEPGGDKRLAFQQVDALPAVTWPEGPIPQQLHLDLMVDSAETLAAEAGRVRALGGTVIDDGRVADPEEPLIVFGDPSGHPFCIFVG